MSEFGAKYDADIPPGNGWEETRDRHANDRRLRSFGFKIEHRPARGPAVWSLLSVEFTELEAHDYCNRAENQARQDAAS